MAATWARRFCSKCDTWTMLSWPPNAISMHSWARVGFVDGESDGIEVGILLVGASDLAGETVGSGVGSRVGSRVGSGVGSWVGDPVGDGVGDGFGLGVGESVGAEVGANVGDKVGSIVGAQVRGTAVSSTAATVRSVLLPAILALTGFAPAARILDMASGTVDTELLSMAVIVLTRRRL